MKRKTAIAMTGLACLMAVAGVGIYKSAWKKPESLQAPVYVFTYAENQPESYPTTKGARKFSELVYKRTEGRIKINVYTDGELGDEMSVLRQVQYGGIDFARLSVMSLGESIPGMNVLQLPYLYRNKDHMWRVLDGEIGDEFLEMAQRFDVVGLSWYDAGARHFYNSVHPVERPEDLRGLKIRVAESELMEAMVSSLHAKPVPMEYSKVYEALVTGNIDGAENNWPSYEVMGHYQAAKYITVDGHSRIPEIQIVSKATWDKLSLEDREIIRACARESALFQREEWEEAEREAEKRLRRAGCVVTELDTSQMIRFRSYVMPLYQRYCGDQIDWLNRIAAE